MKVKVIVSFSVIVMPLLQPSYAEWKSLVDRSHFHGSLSRSINILTTTPMPSEPPSQRFEPFREFFAFLNALSQTYTPLSVELDTGKEKLPKISLGKILEGVPQWYEKYGVCSLKVESKAIEGMAASQGAVVSGFQRQLLHRLLSSTRGKLADPFLLVVGALSGQGLHWRYLC